MLTLPVAFLLSHFDAEGIWWVLFICVFLWEAIANLQ